MKDGLVEQLSQRKCCIYCCSIDLSSMKGCIFHPIGDKVECPACGRGVRQGEIVIMVCIPSGR